MKFIYKMLIGLIVFNGMLLLMGNFFPGTPYNEEVDGNLLNVSSDPSFSGYRNVSDVGAFIRDTFFGEGGWAAIGIFGSALVLGVITRNMLPFLAAGLVLSIVSFIWISSTKFFSDLFNYPIVRDIYVIITVCIFVLVLLSLKSTWGGDD